eukprot:TRINITY_DN17450_c0_g1_i2.p1 TRINITY_DN17450_c0_g1~~TRINITY_DN17450_c0_g1_i2.p1  ORF type:complete len:1097 (-),score=203.72 TRINITY_DN17450_c0_g1_i2:1174-4464(-)
MRIHCNFHVSLQLLQLIAALKLLNFIHLAEAFGPVRLNFGPPSVEVSGWEAAFKTVGVTPFIQLDSFLPPIYGFWSGNLQGVVHTEHDQSALGTFSSLPSGTGLCLMSIPVGSYSLQVNIGDSAGTTDSCLELLGGEKLYDNSTASGAFGSSVLVVHKQSADDCLTLRACRDSTVVNTWEVEQFACHSSCQFCTGTAPSQCALGCNDGRIFVQNSSGSYCTARVPYAPTSLATSEVTNSSLRLSWVSGHSGGEVIHGYRVLASVGGSSEAFEELLATTGSTASTVVLTGLAGDTEHAFKVQGLSAAGQGDLSVASATIRTGPLLPEAPGLPSVDSVEQYSVLLSWTPPGYDGGAAIVSYMVSCFLMPSGDLVKTVSSVGLEANLTGLQGYSLYTFRVRAVNSAGVGDESATSTEVRTRKVPPGPAGTPQATALQQYAFQLSWEYPLFDGGAEITGFQISCSQDGGSFQVLVANSSSNVTSWHLEGLIGYTAYECRVAAWNEIGLGTESATSSTVRTLAVPPYAPGRPSSSNVLLHQLLLSWTAPEGETGAELTGYKVYQKQAGSGPWEVACNDTASDATSWLVSNLEMYTAYVFAVSGLNSVGEGDLSNSSLQAFTAQPDLPHPPAAPTLQNLTPSSLQVAWTQPDDGGTNITGYSIELSTGSEGIFASFLNTSQLSAQLTGLLGNTDYQVRVRAVSDKGLSFPSAASQATTLLPVAPGPPESLLLKIDAPYEASISWVSPTDDGGRPVEAYEVLAGEVGGSMEHNVSLEANARSVLVSSLLGARDYQFQVFARNALGRSPPATAAGVTPSPILPAAPGAVAVADVGQHSASLSWEAPVHDGGARLTGYEVWAEADNADFVLVERLPSDANSTSLTDLLGDTRYMFKVLAVNSLGPGLLSVASDAVRTLPVPPFAPSKLSISDIQQYKVHLAWAPPAKDGGFPITGYRIWLHTNGSDVLVASNTSSNATEYDVTALFGNTAYSFIVAGINSLGVGARSEASNVATTLPVPPAAPSGLYPVEVGSSWAKLEWQVPADGGRNISRYTVEMADANGSSFAQQCQDQMQVLRRSQLLDSHCRAAGSSWWQHVQDTGGSME